MIPTSESRQLQNTIRLRPDKAILKVSFSEIGIDNLGKISTVGYYTKNEKWLEVFENEQPLTLARYPNQHYINISVPGTDGKSFTYESNRPRLWQNEGEVWCHGFWYWSWADKSYKVDEMDASKNWLSFSDKVQYGLKKGYYNASNPTAAGYHKQAGYFRFMNVLYELDQPGEYYVDRNSSVLYIWPLKNSAYTADDVIQVSIINTCIEISANSKNIELNGFTIEACRKFGVKAEKVEDIVFTRMKIQNTGSYGIVASGNGVKISKCVIRNNDGGIDIRGGDRRTLTSSGHEIVDNSITDFGRIGYVGSDGINVVAVGVVVRRNIICRGSYTGIHWAGNDNIFENNMVCDTCLYASDCGGFMTGREMTWCGNVIRRNYITGIQLRVPGADTRGVMLDDQYSCILIEQNVFYNNTIHCNIGGGRDNIVRRNIFYNALRYSMDVDARGAGGKSNTPRIIQLLKRMPYQSNTWKAKYPKLALIDANDLSEVGNPEGNEITENIFCSKSVPAFNRLNKYGPEWFNVKNNIYISDDRNFQAALYGNFKPRCLLEQFVSENKFEDPVKASDCRPRGTVGPIAAQFEIPVLVFLNGNPPKRKKCFQIKNKPAKPPTPLYLPDGYSRNKLYRTSRKGCWFFFKKCSNQSKETFRKKRTRKSQTFYLDTEGKSDTDEHVCLNRVSEMKQQCGTGADFAVIYGPTGAMTLGGDDCYFAWYGCPKLGQASRGRFDRNGAKDEATCLSRAIAQWRYCGSNPSFPVVSIYSPTGHYRAVGAGCWIKMNKCSNRKTRRKTYFYDGEGATNFGTDFIRESCFSRAEYFWRLCGSNPQNKVTASFRPLAEERTYP
ncbi:uncharacterized protein [Mytilus edulis]|uniref:uncharacterized protein n=1 Tax=Mytilus edulis TaxID=6550 RepID=UPI0039EF04F8